MSLLAVCEVLQGQGYDSTTTTVTLRCDKDERQGPVLRSRKSAIRMLFVIVISFAVCNFPYHVRRIFQYYVSSYDRRAIVV